MTSPSPSPTLKYQMPAGQAAAEPAFLQHRQCWALCIDAVSPTQILRHLIRDHNPIRAKATTSLSLSYTCSTKGKDQLPSSLSHASPQLLHRKRFIPLNPQRINPVVSIFLKGSKRNQSTRRRNSRASLSIERKVQWRTYSILATASCHFHFLMHANHWISTLHVHP